MASNTPPVEIEIDDKVVRVSNPDRVYFPERGETSTKELRRPGGFREQAFQLREYGSLGIGLELDRDLARIAQDDDAGLKAAFAPLAATLAAKEQAIVGELAAVQGQPVDIGGYYRPDLARVGEAMRPSPTFNAALASL